MTAHHHIRRGVGGALGVSLICGFLVTAPSPALADSLEVISTESTEWQYLDIGVDPADGADDLFAWAQPEFDDSNWPTAVGPFGSMHGELEDPMHGDFPVSTHLNQHYAEGDREGGNIEAFFFRTTVDIDAAELEDADTFIGNIHYDDAVKVFVNGEEVWGGRDDRFNPDAGTNLQYVGGNDVPPVSEEFTVDAEHFEAGENTIAVSLYNTNEGSSDIYLQFEQLAAAAEEDLEPEPAPVDLNHLNGSGAATDPYQISTAEELVAVAEAINTDAETYAAASYALTGDIDLTGVDFPLIDTFSGIFDGADHTIHGLNVSEESADGNTRTAFFRQNSGVIQNVHLDAFHYSSDAVVDGSGPAVAALVAQNDGGIIQGNTLTGMVIDAPGLEKVAGLVAQTHGGLVEDNFVEGQVTARYMPAGAVSYVNGQGEINRNLVDAELVTVEPGGERGTNASMVATYPNGAVVESNVVLDGSIAYDGTVEDHAGRVIGWMGFSDVLTLADNLAAETVTIAGSPVDGARDDQNGESVAPEDLAEMSTYAELGWDFDTQWAWDADRNHPMPAGTGQAGPDGDGEPERVVLTATEDPSSSQYVTWRTRSLERLEGTVEFRASGTEETTTVTAEQKPERSVTGSAISTTVHPLASTAPAQRWPR